MTDAVDRNRPVDAFAHTYSTQPRRSRPNRPNLGRLRLRPGPPRKPLPRENAASPGTPSLRRSPAASTPPPPPVMAVRRRPRLFASSSIMVIAPPPGPGPAPGPGSGPRLTRKRRSPGERRRFSAAVSTESRTADSASRVGRGPAGADVAFARGLAGAGKRGGGFSETLEISRTTDGVQQRRARASEHGDGCDRGGGGDASIAPSTECAGGGDTVRPGGGGGGTAAASSRSSRRTRPTALFDDDDEGADAHVRRSRREPRGRRY